MKIGFIDYFIDEWHANNYPAWIREASGGADTIALAWAMTDKPGGRTAAQWCADFGVAQASSIQEVVQGCDAIVVLSPDHAEQHPALCDIPLRSGKPVYVDKTFATDTATARALFALAAEHGTPMYSSSALRYSDEILGRPASFTAQSGVTAVHTRGPGVITNYGVHQLEMVTALMGTGAQRVRYVPEAAKPTMEIDYGGRSASICFDGDDFTFRAENSAGEVLEPPQCSNFFPNFIQSMLEFFHTGVPAVPAGETIEIMAILEAGASAAQQPGTWVALG